MIERTTIRLPENLLAAAKQRALLEGRTVTSLIIEGLNRVLEQRVERGELRMPRVCQASLKSNTAFPLVDLGAEDAQDDLEKQQKLKFMYGSSSNADA